jgi:soluble lytic murein transglycosylase
MQLMPETASRTAKSITLPVAVERLTRDPDYNRTIGSAHVQDLLGNYNGSYVLTLVAYNAGPGRARQWIEQFGDPRWPEVDAIDWVEMIPFDETRNYVQRVMEAMAVYRQRLAGDAPVRVTLKQDLKR